MGATDNGLLVTQYYGCWVVDFYNGHRPHRTLALTRPEPIRPPSAPAPEWREARVQRRDRLGGVVHEYVLTA
jgi:hypothetical protein